MSKCCVSVCKCVFIVCLWSPAGPTVKPSVSLLPPSSLQLSEGSASLLCLLSAYSPQGALVSWTVDGSEVKDGVLTSAEEQKKDGYTRSSTLTLSKAVWERGRSLSVQSPMLVSIIRSRSQRASVKTNSSKIEFNTELLTHPSTIEFQFYTMLTFLSLLSSLSCCSSCSFALLK